MYPIKANWKKRWRLGNYIWTLRQSSPSHTVRLAMWHALASGTTENVIPAEVKKMHVHWGLLSLLLFLGTLWPLLCKQAGISQLWQEIHGQVTSTAQLNLCQLSDTDWGHPPSSIPSQATSWPQGSDEPIQPRTTQSMHKITRRISIHYLNPHTGGGMLH